MKTLHFGIEIEMTGITRNKATQLIAHYFKTGRTNHIGGKYDTYTALDPIGRTWRVVRDGSILTQKKMRGELMDASDSYSTEVVSPILSYEDIPEVQELIRAFRKAGAFVNASCGVHIHVGAERFTPKSLRNLVNIMASKEDLIYNALGVSRNRATRYCKKANLQFLAEINDKKPQTIDEFRELWYKEDPYNIQQHYNQTRYYGLNLHATFTKGTVEFRVFNGTLHAGEVKTYIQFCLAVTKQALTQSKASLRRTTTDNEKYAFRCWLLRLGLIGDEFKTCRYHLLKRLSGNAAWRHTA